MPHGIDPADAVLRKEWVEPREGMVTVYDHEGRYLGCMGIETWQRLLDEERDRRRDQRAGGPE